MYIEDVKQRTFELLVEIFCGDEMEAYVQWKKLFPRSVMKDRMELEEEYNRR